MIIKAIKRVIKNSYVCRPLVAIHQRRSSRRILKAQRAFDQVKDTIFTNIRVDPLVIKVDEFDGNFEIDFRSDLFSRIARFGTYETQLSKLALKHLDSSKDVIDVGANVGFFSVLLSKHLGEGRRLLAIEPTPHAMSYLKRNLARNCPEARVVLFEGVAADSVGTVEIKTIKGMEEYSTMGTMNQRDFSDLQMESLAVKSETLDNLVKVHGLNPGLVKIDTEGAEFLVLSGAIETLKTYKPVIVSELCDNYLSAFGKTSGDVIELLKGCGYKVFSLFREDGKIEFPYTGDIIAIPEDQDHQAVE